MIEGSMYSVFLGLLSGRAGPKLQPQASNPEQHNNTTTRRLYGVDTILPHLTIGFLQRPHEYLMCIPRVLYEFLPTASQRFPQSGWVISSGKLSQVLGDRRLQTPSQDAGQSSSSSYSVVGSKAPIVHLSPLGTSDRSQPWLVVASLLPTS